MLYINLNRVVQFVILLALVDHQLSRVIACFERCLTILTSFSLVEGEHPVGDARPVGDHTVEAPEAAVLAVNPADQGLVSAVAEGCVGAHLAVAKLEVARLAHVE
jgi:hypothetical protein